MMCVDSSVFSINSLWALWLKINLTTKGTEEDGGHRELFS